MPACRGVAGEGARFIVSQMLVFLRIALVALMSLAGLRGAQAQGAAESANAESATKSTEKPGVEPDGDAGDVDSLWNLDRVELSGFLGVHLSSDISALGARTGVPASVSSAISFGPRASYLLLPWLAFESELLIAPSSARDSDVEFNVLVLEPRLNVRFEPVRLDRFLPFVSLGAGAPIALSGESQILRNDASFRAHLGGGVLVQRDGEWNLRLDARFFAMSQRGGLGVTPEFEMSLGVYYSFNAEARKPTLTEWLEERDDDGDGIPNERDECPDRDEDRDGHEDDDGCPDIDNDLDLVLDIADKCPDEAERHNGFDDEDGCPDNLPRAVSKIVGVVAGQRYRSRSARLTRPGRRALRRVARTMREHPSVRVVVIGHADDREAGEKSDELSLRRARAVRDFLVNRKIAAWRIKIEGRGARDPIGANKRRRGRSKNRRVEIELRVYGPRN